MTDQVYITDVAKHVGQTITIKGWLYNKRDKGRLQFLMLRDGRATTVTSYMYLVPAVTALMAWAMFGESLEPLALAGTAVTLTGIWLVAGGRSDRRHPS